ncbi:hypothetical protein AQUCO_00900879v1 [Aquilegia coerulea]|uniref:glucan endo-1,3-beta-D-glucosidase n=1 Tax=Aquilegia coerulea TaxID=218851 RepID=A0A2G5EFW3_AQUCA|nr:hypothetical protein AQUCO_00900879v1 [Aquilegia coerulea]
MNLFSVLFLFSFFVLVFSNATISNTIGINYGQLGNNLPSPSKSIQLINSLKASSVKIYDANPQILSSLSGTKFQVYIMVPNEQILQISSNKGFADDWLRTNLLPFYPKTNIRYILVGNEIFSTNQNQQLIWQNVVAAMESIQRSLITHKLFHIKVSTTHAMDVLQSSFPPSNGTFRSDISVAYIEPLLGFLNKSKSSFFLDVYTYFPWSTSPNDINLDYALLNQGNITYTDPVSKLTYTNLLDQMLDSVIFAMKKLGYPDLKLTIAETGWPTAGDIDQIGANIYNAATYNRNLVQKLSAKPPVGTPARPGVVIPAFLFALFNENQKPGPTTERNWGLFYPNGTQVFKIKLDGKLSESDKKLPAPGNNNAPYKGKLWCVVAKEMEKNSPELKSALTYACGQRKGTCDAIKPGKECYKQGNLALQASYAFASYWAKFKRLGATCYFNGLGVLTAKDPSFGSCKFPSLRL